MKIGVNNITFYEQGDWLQARVGIRGEHDDEASPFAEVTIWIPKRDVPLSELNQHAIDAALEFLKSVVAVIRGREIQTAIITDFYGVSPARFIASIIL